MPAVYAETLVSLASSCKYKHLESPFFFFFNKMKTILSAEKLENLNQRVSKQVETTTIKTVF